MVTTPNLFSVRQYRYKQTVKNAKKNLKIPKGQSESVNRRWTDNTMVKIKKDKRMINDLQNTPQIKLKIGQHEPH